MPVLACQPVSESRLRRWNPAGRRRSVKDFSALHWHVPELLYLHSINLLALEVAGTRAHIPQLDSGTH